MRKHIERISALQGCETAFWGPGGKSVFNNGIISAGTVWVFHNAIPGFHKGLWHLVSDLVRI